jgi:hypothetical protein
MVLLPRFADSQSLYLEPIRTFQTVSLGSSVNRGTRDKTDSSRRQHLEYVSSAANYGGR